MEKGRTKKITVLIADDHPMMLMGICNVLSTKANLEIVAKASNGEEALEEIRTLSPDIAILDINMPLIDGLDVASQMRDEGSPTKVIILSLHDDQEKVTKFLKSGAMGYVLKKNSPEELLSAIEEVYLGEAFLSPSISKAILDEARKSSFSSATKTFSSCQELSKRQVEVLTYLAQGLSTKQIADILPICESTVSKCRENIKKKLNLHTTAELVKYAISKGLI